MVQTDSTHSLLLALLLPLIVDLTLSYFSRQLIERVVYHLKHALLGHVLHLRPSLPVFPVLVFHRLFQEVATLFTGLSEMVHCEVALGLSCEWKLVVLETLTTAIEDRLIVMHVGRC